VISYTAGSLNEDRSDVSCTSGGQDAHHCSNTNLLLAKRPLRQTKSTGPSDASAEEASPSAFCTRTLLGF